MISWQGSTAVTPKSGVQHFAISCIGSRKPKESRNQADLKNHPERWLATSSTQALLNLTRRVKRTGRQRGCSCFGRKPKVIIFLKGYFGRPLTRIVMSAKPKNERFQLNQGRIKIISGASFQSTRKINLSRFHEVWGKIKTINGGSQSPQQLPSLCKDESVGPVGLFLAQVRGKCRSEASEKEVKELSANPLKILDRPWFYPSGVA